MNLAEFGVRKPVVANLVMLAVIGAGLVFGLQLRREFFPMVESRVVLVFAPYPGAAPEEVERALAVKIEDQLDDLDDVKEITSTVNAGGATVRVEFEEGINIEAAVAEVKREIDALQDLPDQADRITVQELEPNLPAIVLAMYGDADEQTMKSFIEQTRDDLQSIPGMGEITLDGTRGDEVRVEVRPSALLRHRLSVGDVADRVSASMQELPAGTVRSSTANISVRALGVEERAEEIRRIPIKSTPDGQVLRLEDVADVYAGFVDTDLYVRLNGAPAVSLTVFKVGDDDVIDIAELVKAYAKGRRGEAVELTWGERIGLLMGRMRLQAEQDRLAEAREALVERGVLSAEEATLVSDAQVELGTISDRLAAWSLGRTRYEQGPVPGTLVVTTDLARFVEGRLDLLTRNALWGGLLVFGTLVLLLNRRVSLWVAVGLVVSMFGTLAMMSWTGVTLNLLTMFGLIIVIGILVDDAIVVAENITARHEQGEPALVAAVNGTRQVSWPVVATVLTTICAFLPLALIEGQIGDFMVWLPMVVAVALLVSLLESLFILPSHMAHSLKAIDREEQRGGSLIGRLELRFDRARDALFNRVIVPNYMSVLRRAVRHRYISVSIAIALVFVSVGMVAMGRPEFILFETEDSETVNITVQMPIGTPATRTDDIVRQIEDAALEQPEVVSAWAVAGAIGDLNGEGEDSTASHIGQVILELAPTETRDRTSDQVQQSIRALLGELPDVKSLRMAGISGGPDGPGLSYTITGAEEDVIDRAATMLMERMEEYAGVQDVATDSDAGQLELRFVPTESGRVLGFTEAFLGRQIQGAVFGIDAYTFAGNREDVDVRVVLPEEIRRSPSALESMYVVTPDGTPVPLGEVARIETSEAYATLHRLDRRRAVTVTADVNRAVNNPDMVAVQLKSRLREIEAQLPGVRILERGRQEDFNDSFSTLPLGMAVAAGLIYVVLAWLFGSFTQPLVVMAAIPFAVIGMIWGHIVLGFNLTFLSLIGFVALSGIVVNDSLIFMEFFNEQRRRGKDVYDSALAAGRARVRAIVLTTVTTSLGLLPLMLEQSFQARFLIPMAITIACGLISATAIILLVLPCLLQILDDIVHVFRVLWTGDLDAERANPFVPDPELALLDKQDGVA